MMLCLLLVCRTGKKKGPDGYVQVKLTKAKKRRQAERVFKSHEIGRRHEGKSDVRPGRRQREEILSYACSREKGGRRAKSSKDATQTKEEDIKEGRKGQWEQGIQVKGNRAIKYNHKARPKIPIKAKFRFKKGVLTKENGEHMLSGDKRLLLDVYWGWRWR